MSSATKRSPVSTKPAASANINREETPFEALASICSVLVVGLFILTFLAQNYVIPSGSMKNTLLIGDHLVVDRITLMPPTSWMPLIRYREPRRGDIVVFIKPVHQPGIDPTDADGTPQETPLVKRLIGVPGDHIHLRNGIVIVNGVAQPVGFAQPTTTDNFNEFLDDFPAVPPSAATGADRVVGRELLKLYPGRRPGGSTRHVLHDGRQPAQQPGLALLGLRATRQHNWPAAVQLLVVRGRRWTT